MVHTLSCELVAKEVDLSTKAMDGQEQKGWLVGEVITVCYCLYLDPRNRVTTHKTPKINIEAASLRGSSTGILIFGSHTVL